MTSEYKHGVMPVHFTGSANEHLAAYWYLRQGYMILWPDPAQSHIDFVTFKEGAYQRIQVKTASMVRTGDWHFLQCRTRLTNRYKDTAPTDLYDILFVVYGEDGWVIPAAAVDSSNLSLGSDCDKTAVSRWAPYMVRMNQPPLLQISESSQPKQRSVAPPPVEELNALRTDRKSLQQIADHFMVPRHEVKRWCRLLKDRGLAPSQSRGLRPKRTDNA